MKFSHLVLAIAISAGVSSAAQAAPKFAAYEGKNSISEGEGGTKATVDGIEFWEKGAPPRKFQVLGSLTDERHASGILGMIRMASLDKDIAAAAKKAGGDAVILVGEGQRVVGMATTGNSNVFGNFSATGSFNANSFNSGVTSAIRKNDVEYVVVKYLPQDSQPATTPVAPPAPPASPAQTVGSRP